jgi:hypothetical protein
LLMYQFHYFAGTFYFWSIAFRIPQHNIEIWTGNSFNDAAFSITAEGLVCLLTTCTPSISTFQFPENTSSNFVGL